MGLTMCLAMGLGPGDKTQLNNDKARPQHSTPYLIPYLCIRMGHAHALYISCSANCRLYIIVIKREKFLRLFAGWLFSSAGKDNVRQSAAEDPHNAK